MPEEILKKESINLHKKLDLIAGHFDDKTQRPRVELRIYPKHKASLVKWEEVDVGTKTNYTKVFKIHNQSSDIVFVELVKLS